MAKGLHDDTKVDHVRFGRDHGPGAGQAPQKQAPAPAAPAPTQSRPAAPPTLQRPQEKPPEVAPDQPVISIRGLCPADTGVATQNAVPSTKQCVTTMTSQQFDNLVKALNTSNQPVLFGDAAQTGGIVRGDPDLLRGRQGRGRGEYPYLSRK